MTKVAINGFGRIGRTVFRTYLKRIAKGDNRVEIVAVNNPLRGKQKISDFIHMLRNDSVHGRLDPEVVKIEVEENAFVVNGKRVTFNTESDPANIDWSKDGVEVVIDSTGFFKDRASLGKNIRGTVKKVIMGAPGEDIDGTFVLGVNENEYNPDKHHIVSNASCTTNCLGPVVKVLDEAFGVEKGQVSTTHAMTMDQKLLDSEHDDLRRARAASVNIIPTKTGAATALGKIMPHLKGKLDGIALRVPVADVSVVDAALILKKEVTPEEVNEVLRKAAQGPLKGILDVTEEELVSTDFIGNPHSSIVDSKYTKTMGNLVKILSWYDNEAGYSNRLLDLARILLPSGK